MHVDTFMYFISFIYHDKLKYFIAKHHFAVSIIQIDSKVQKQKRIMYKSQIFLQNDDKFSE